MYLRRRCNLKYDPHQTDEVLSSAPLSLASLQLPGRSNLAVAELSLMQDLYLLVLIHATLCTCHGQNQALCANYSAAFHAVHFDQSREAAMFANDKTQGESNVYSFSILPHYSGQCCHCDFIHLSGFSMEFIHVVPVNA